MSYPVSDKLVAQPFLRNQNLTRHLRPYYWLEHASVRHITPKPGLWRAASLPRSAGVPGVRGCELKWLVSGWPTTREFYSTTRRFSVT